MSKLLLFSLFLFSGVVAAAIEKPAEPEGSGMAIHRLTPDDSASFDRSLTDNSSASDDVCYNIHAFIFKADDDRIPKLVRETTCMPAGHVRAKKADQNVQPKLIPATGDNSF